MRMTRYPSEKCRAQFGPCRQRSREHSCGEMNTHGTENGKYNNVPKIILVAVVKGIEATRQRQIFVKEPAVEITAFVGIARYEIVHVRKIMEEH